MKYLLILLLFCGSGCATTETVLEVHGAQVQAHLHIDGATVSVFPQTPIDGAIRWSSKTGFSIVPSVGPLPAE